ncbi:Hypothetical protein ABZS17I87_02503 [Kosakonia cowanii]
MAIITHLVFAGKSSFCNIAVPLLFGCVKRSYTLLYSSKTTTGFR